jgi:hypothetical protein
MVIFDHPSALYRKILKILSRILLTLLLLLITVWVLIQFTPVQNWLVKQTAKKLSAELQTEVTVKHVDFSLFKKMLLEGVLVKDHRKDTLVYIGRAGLNISNWFFLKQKATISNVQLENVTANLHRSDSVWNYQFLIDYFSSPASEKKKKEGVELKLEDLLLRNIHIVQKDEWRGETIEGRLLSLKLKPNLINFKQQVIDIDRLEADLPYFLISNYQGKRPPVKKKEDAEFHLTDSVVHWNTGAWVIKASSVFINDGEFRNEVFTNRAPDTYFDGMHIRFYNINAGFTNLVLKGDSLQTHVRLSAKERSGFEIKEMIADLLWHPSAMEFSKLNIETPKSRLSNFFALRFSNFNHDMGNFISHVVMDGNFVNSKIHTSDLAFFAPELKKWNDLVKIKGSIKGTVEHLKGKNIVLETGKQTLFEGDFVMDGLPDISNTFLDIDAKRFTTNYADASAIFPGLKTITKPALYKLNNLSFNGSFTGYLKDFVTYGTIKTNLGTVVSDINLKIPTGGQPIYSGKIKTERFELGTFLNEPLLGKIVMEGSLKGKGFNVNTLFAELDAKLHQIEINGYNYHNITSKGIVDHKKFDGALSINDTNLIMNLTGIIDLGKDTPVYRVNGNLYSANFKKLGFTKLNLFLSGDFDFDFRVKNIEDFMGTALMRNAVLMNGDQKLSFDSLYLSNRILGNGQKQLIVQSNEIDASITGNYNLVNLPDLTTGLLSNYFPAYIPAPKRKINDQDIEFNIQTKNISQFISLLDLPLSGFDNSSIIGNINIRKNLFNLNTNIPSFEYKGVLFDNVTITGVSNFNQLLLKGSIERVLFNDSLNLPNTNFTVAAANDTGFVSLTTSASQTLKDANLNAHFKASRDGFTINFEPSTLLLNEKKWTIEDNSGFFIGKQKIYSEGVRLTSGSEELFVYTHPSETGNDNDIVVELRRVEAGDILPYFLTDPRLEGSITGRVDIMNPFGKIQADGRFSAERFRFNNDSVGLVTLSANYNSVNGEINYDVESDNLNHHFKAKGSTNIKNLEDITTDHVIVFENQSLKILEPYLSVIMSNLKGTGSGTVRVKGKGEAPELIGNIRLNKTSFLLDYTKCRYIIEDGSVIGFKEGQIDFGTIQLKDTTGRTAKFSGKLYHRFFRNMAFDMQFSANDAAKGLLVLNTTKKDNTLFYGTVIANARGSITGPSENMKIRLFGEPTDSSKLYIPTSDSRVTGTADFIVFRKYGTEMQIESKVKETSSLSVDLDVRANPLAKVFLILDEITNDIIEGQGNGNINLKVGTNESTTMTGNFEITKGRYTFNWQRLFKRPFLIDKGSITWNGDPYNASINIDANYVVEDATLLPEYASGCSNARSNILVVSNLSNTLKDIVIKFRFELPLGHPCRNNPLTKNAFEQLKNNPDELNRQVISLMLVGTFISSNSKSSFGGATIGNSFLTSAAGTLSEFVAQQIASGLNAAFDNIPGLKDLKLDPYITFSPGLISGAESENLGFGGTGRFGFTKRVLKGKILIKAGGSLLLATTQANLGQNNNQLTPDISIEWLLTPDGKLRLIGFYRTIFDAQRRNDRTGISFSYIKEFDKLF